MSDAPHHGRPEVDAHTGVETTGHEWDGIKELNNPLPRWWLYIFYASAVFAVVYMFFMPAIPGLPGSNWHSRGWRGHSERANVAADVAALQASRRVHLDTIANAAPGEIANDPELSNLVFQAGGAVFKDNCVTCHGAGGQGARGYPNLADDDWIWGGTLDDIRQTIRFGVRNEHLESRFSQMPAFGRDGLLERDQIRDLTEYVISLSGEEADADAVARAAPVFEMQCAACHGADGSGDQFQGAPNLTDHVWLYGGDRETVRETITNSRYGVMPNWSARLDDATLELLAVYVHSALGGGEPG